jgi:hypothetical protein
METPAPFDMVCKVLVTTETVAHALTTADKGQQRPTKVGFYVQQTRTIDSNSIRPLNIRLLQDELFTDSRLSHPLVSWLMSLDSYSLLAAC